MYSEVTFPFVSCFIHNKRARLVRQHQRCQREKIGHQLSERQLSLSIVYTQTTEKLWKTFSVLGATLSSFIGQIHCCNEFYFLGFYKDQLNVITSCGISCIDVSHQQLILNVKSIIIQNKKMNDRLTSSDFPFFPQQFQ